MERRIVLVCHDTLQRLVLDHEFRASYTTVVTNYYTKLVEHIFITINDSSRGKRGVGHRLSINDSVYHYSISRVDVKLIPK